MINKDFQHKIENPKWRQKIRRIRSKIDDVWDEDKYGEMPEWVDPSWWSHAKSAEVKWGSSLRPLNSILKRLSLFPWIHFHEWNYYCWMDDHYQLFPFETHDQRKCRICDTTMVVAAGAFD